jgi:DivIVA domain-containing protein
MRKKDMPVEGSGFETSDPNRLTPFDIQEKTFRTARLGGGYQVREVDEFLDQVTDTLSALIAENERLASGHPAPAPAAPAPQAVGDEERAAVDAFLQRERTFLQSLGALVQEHAEALRQMARTARRGPAATPAPAVTEESRDAKPDEADASAEATEDEPAVVQAPSVEPAVIDESAAAPPNEDADEDEIGDMAAPPTAEQPIRLEEPEPARSRPESETEGSLRELFWGED